MGASEIKSMDGAVKTLMPTITALAVMTALLTLGVLIRVWFSIKQFRQYRLEFSSFMAQDFFLLLVWLCFLTEYVLTHELMKQMAAVERRLPSGASLNYLELALFVPQAQVSRLMQTAFAMFLINIVCLWLTKTPLYFLYLTIAMKSTLPKPLRMSIVCGAVFHAASFAGTFLSSLFACGPDISRNWGVNECHTVLAVPQLVIFTTLSVSGDLILMILGLFTIRFLLANSRSRPRSSDPSHPRIRTEGPVIAFILGIGLLSLSACIVRFALVLRVPEAEGLTHLPVYVQWYSIETMAAVTACNIPSLRSLLRECRIPCRKRKHGGRGEGAGRASAYRLNRSDGSQTEMMENRQRLDQRSSDDDVEAGRGF